jgi:hypothetical protein
MICIPFTVKPGIYDIMVVLEQENIDRIKEYDPAMIPLDDFPEPFKSMQLSEVHITFGNKEDLAFCMAQEQGPAGLKIVLEHLTRGWKYKPEQGDNDQGPQQVRAN